MDTRGKKQTWTLSCIPAAKWIENGVHPIGLIRPKSIRLNNRRAETAYIEI